MIRITHLFSGSSGNAYHVTDGTTPLLIECGVPIRRIREALHAKGLRLSGVHACLISHEHGDHCAAAVDVAMAGIPIYMSGGTGGAIWNRADKRFVFRVLEDGRFYDIGTWGLVPFRVVHDAAEPLGFYLASGDDRLVFLTDTAYSPFTFPGLTHLMIECNYSAAAFDRAVEAGSTHPAQRKRLLHSHFSLEQVVEMLNANDLSRLKEVHLLHLSNNNSDEAEMVREIRRLTGVPVYVA